MITNNNLRPDLKPTIPDNCKCFHLDCNTEITEIAMCPQPNHEMKEIYFCAHCYDALTSSRIIIDGKVKEWQNAVTNLRNNLSVSQLDCLRMCTYPLRFHGITMTIVLEPFAQTYKQTSMYRYSIKKVASLNCKAAVILGTRCC